MWACTKIVRIWRNWRRLEDGIVLMEYLQDDEWKMMAEIQDKESVKDKVTKAVSMRTFHESGYVHGDLWDYNIMVKTNMKEVKILDFDWAGPVGEARYPWFMNPNIPWHPDVHPNELIHEYFVKKTCGK
jgi:RIO-like serine/threonine protein kinase